jgi:hypothetical protein
MDNLINNPTRFRLWVQNIWIDNCEENLAHNQTPYKMKEYWEKYKWWLRREYKFQKSKHD